MTGSTAISLGKNFSKYLTTVMPFVLELATPNVPHGEEDEEVEELDDEDGRAEITCHYFKVT